MNTEEIKPNAVYTTEESERLLKVSKSTMKRLIKRGIIRANKVGRQYRIMGKELLRIISPKTEEKATKWYLDLKDKVYETVRDWE